MYRYRKKRVYRILGLLGLAGGMFLVFQLFSMEILSFHAKREDSRIRNSFIAKKELGKVDDAKLSVRVTPKTPGPADKMDPDCLEGNCDNSVHIVNKNVHDKVVKYGVDKYKQQADLIRTTIKDSHYEKLVAKCKALSIGSKEDLWQFLEYCFADTHSPGNSSVRGVFSGWAHLYRADSNGMFTCIKSQEKISFKLINDDYCDCSDGSDEPGTSACGGSRFYCTFQVSGGAPTWFPSSRVDDMLCDCCDGSDEPRKSLLPHHVVLDSKTQYYGVRQAPCSDQCQELVSKGQALAEMREQGAVIKQAYIQAAMGQDNVKQIYGEDGAFYKLSQICINANSDKYVYEVCPFRHVKQSWSTLPFKMIGRDGEWMSTGRRGWTLKMGNGESNQCPGMRARVSFIKFHCGLKDAVMTVGETEVCEYTVHFSTPAAC